MARSSRRVLVVHNAYQQRGGEDSVVESEVALLREHGHEVELLLRHNDEVSRLSRVDVALQTLWSRETTRDMAERIGRFRPDVVHVHNTLPLVSPSVFWAAAGAGVPAVMTLHNFRLLCPQATLLRDGAICERCVGRAPVPAIVHRCYRESVVQTGGLVSMLMLHRGLGTFRNKVSRFIALTEFGRDKFIEGGLPAERIDVKPNFVHWMPRPDSQARRGGLYVGRLSVEKGVEPLLQAMRLHPAHALEIIGSGPFEKAVAEVAGERWLGPVPLTEVLDRMRRASYLLVPSVCYEGFPRTIVEAFACGTPVIASRRGSLAELVEDGRTGLLFDPDDPMDMVERLKWADANPDAMRRMGMVARSEYEERFSPQRNHELLMQVYDRAGASAQ